MNLNNLKTIILLIHTSNLLYMNTSLYGIASVSRNKYISLATLNISAPKTTLTPNPSSPPPPGHLVPPLAVPGAAPVLLDRVALQALHRVPDAVRCGAGVPRAGRLHPLGRHASAGRRGRRSLDRHRHGHSRPRTRQTQGHRRTSHAIAVLRPYHAYAQRTTRHL